MSSDTKAKIWKAILVILTIYLFLLSIKLLGHSFKLFGRGFAETMIQMTSNPFAGLIIGIVSTSVIQSSSTTTSIVVGLVAGGALSLDNAIPIVMGANIGTTITNILVSFGLITNRLEFRRALGASIVHDFFNLCSVIVLFPIEINFHIIKKLATVSEKGFAELGGLHMFNPLKIVLDPAINGIDFLFSFIPYSHVCMLVLSLIMLFAALAFLVKSIRSLVLEKIEIIINKYLFKYDLLSFSLGVLLTAVVQSSSVTTSIVVPLAGAGLISIRQIFPYTLGANIGTTVTAILAALATQNNVAVMVAFAHLSFNILGTLIFYPLKFIPIKLAEYVSYKASQSTKNLIFFIIILITLFFVPVVFIIFD